jgi:hypothetical protein
MQVRSCGNLCKLNIVAGIQISCLSLLEMVLGVLILFFTVFLPSDFEVGICRGNSGHKKRQGFFAKMFNDCILSDGAEIASHKRAVFWRFT